MKTSFQLVVAALIAAGLSKKAAKKVARSKFVNLHNHLQELNWHFGRYWPFCAEERGITPAGDMFNQPEWDRVHAAYEEDYGSTELLDGRYFAFVACFFNAEVWHGEAKEEIAAVLAH